MQRYEGYHHNKLEPPEEPPYCGICGGSHEDLDCPEDEPEDEEDEYDPSPRALHPTDQWCDECGTHMAPDGTCPECDDGQPDEALEWQDYDPEC